MIRAFVASRRHRCTSFPRGITVSRCFSSEDAPKRRQSKVKKLKKGPSGDDGSHNRNLQLVLAALDAPFSKESPVSEDEAIRRFGVGRSYNVGTSVEHNKIQHALACKIRLKQHAVNMLPKNSRIRADALQESDTLPPDIFKMPVWTPPIQGFDPSVYMKEDD